MLLCNIYIFKLTVGAVRRRRSSPRRTFLRVLISMTWWSTQQPPWDRATFDWLWCSPMERTRTSGLLSTVESFTILNYKSISNDIYIFTFTAVDFFNQINMLYGTITEFCTEESCPIMSAGPKYEYHWADGQTVKKPIKCSAPKYIDYLMTWVQDQLDDENLFPSKIGE